METAKLDANEIQWKRTSFTLYAEDAKAIVKRQDARAFETYLMIKKIDGKWTNTGIQKELEVKFSWLKMNRKISNELAKTGIYQIFEDVVRELPDGRTLPGVGTTLFVYKNEL